MLGLNAPLVKATYCEHPKPCNLTSLKQRSPGTTATKFNWFPSHPINSNALRGQKREQLRLRYSRQAPQRPQRQRRRVGDRQSRQLVTSEQDPLNTVQRALPDPFSTAQLELGLLHQHNTATDSQTLRRRDVSLSVYWFLPVRAGSHCNAELRTGYVTLDWGRH